MYKIIVYKGREFRMSYSKYLQFMTYSKAIIGTSWADSEKSAAIERYLKKLIN